MASLRPMPAPAPPTPLIAREAESASVTDLVDAGGRLVTLTGPPGVGRTRLALHLAGLLADRFPEGVAFAPLDVIADAALVPAALARALGVREEAGQPLAETLADAGPQGPQGATGPQGPQGPIGPGSQQYFARNGLSPTGILAGGHVTAVQKTADGNYNITFDRDMRKCAWTATYNAFFVPTSGVYVACVSISNVNFNLLIAQIRD